MPDFAGPITPSPLQDTAEEPLLSVRDLCKHFPVRQGIFNRQVATIRAVDGVDFDLFNGECLGLVGESGSGKTTIGRCLLRAYRPTRGSALFRPGHGSIDLASADDRELKRFRRHIQMVFQDPFASLNPRMTVFDIVGEPLLVQGMSRRRDRAERVQELLVQVGMKADHLHRYPHAFSGGQRQRIGIARALALNPSLIVADEPVSALDVSVQAQVLNLLMKLQQQHGLTYLFIGHDLSVVRHLCDRIAVMYVGRLVELADAEQLFSTPRHPYTWALLTAAPNPDPTVRRKRIVLRGEVPDPANAPSGCPFHPRCPKADQRCRDEVPALRAADTGGMIRCHYPLTDSEYVELTRDQAAMAGRDRPEPE